MGNIEFTFNDVSLPKKQVASLILYKKKYEDEQKIKLEKDLEGDQRNFDVLVDTLGEIMREYLDKAES
ncbi:MAG: hypothetical protein LBI53_01140 [Candidatus Peribacteria bacterium]|nr:hypothetical protein [Candidatus Peribacteria bacterium]